MNPISVPVKLLKGEPLMTRVPTEEKALSYSAFLPLVGHRTGLADHRGQARERWAFHFESLRWSHDTTMSEHLAFVKTVMTNITATHL